jgi:hypothetical protein
VLNVAAIVGCRNVLKPQAMLAYTNSSGSSAIKNCIVGRWREFKWYGNSNRVFR